MIQTFSFDDILIRPKAFCNIESRAHIDTSADFYGHKLSMPIISASMSAFDTKNPDSHEIDIEFASLLSDLGGMHILSRATLFSDRISSAKYLSLAGKNVGLAVSLKEFAVYREQLEELDAFVSIDIANGALIHNIDWEGKYPLILGNYGNPGAVFRSDLKGEIIYKFGIGSGSSCSTRLKTGVGAPQGWLIHEVSKMSTKLNKPIISDGGVKSVADFSKAVALGADAVMSGYLLASAQETPWEPVKINDRWYKPYRGMASFEEKNSTSHIEGISGFIPYEDKPLKSIMLELKDGLTSSMSYCNARTLDEFKAKAEFILAPTNDLETGTRLYG